MRVFGRPPAIGAEFRAFLHPVPHKEIAVNKAELTAALAMRTKMSKADASRTVEALFDDKGIIATELKKGAKVQITGFGNFEARKRAARMGRNPSAISATYPTPAQSCRRETRSMPPPQSSVSDLATSATVAILTWILPSYDPE